MKKKIIICVICLLGLVLVTILILRYNGKNNVSALYEKYQYPNEEYYGKDLYSEIDYECSEYESEVGEMIVKKAFEVAHYTGTEQDSETEMGDVGALRRYYYFDTKDAHSQEADFQFITCKINGNEGHVWVETSITRYDKNGKSAGGGGYEMLSLWYIEYQENGWYVVEVLDTP